MKCSMFRWLLPVVAAGAFSVAFPSLLFAANPVPYLNPLQPDAATPGGSAFVLTVTGTGFVSTSVVNWNGGPRTTTFVNASKLTAQITAADIATPTTATITVATPGGGVSNSQYFQVAYSLSQLTWTYFSLTGINPTTSRVVGADFNGDGKSDWAVAMGSRVFVIPGNGNGTYGSPIASSGPASGTITGLYVADINGDGKPDLILTGPVSTSKFFVVELIGNGDGTFQAPIETDFNGSIPNTAVLADFNGDGVLDLAYANAAGVQTLLGQSNGTFQLGSNSPLSQIGLAAVATGDFDNDGKLDLVVTVYDAYSSGLDFVGVMKGDGAGGFGALSPLNGSGTPFVGSITAAVGDFNGDGKLDIATAIQTVGATLQGIIQVSQGNGDLTFATPYNVPNVPDVTTPLLVGDFNGDGKLDLSTGGFIYYGDGNGGFATSSGATGLPTFVLASDAKGDGQLDLITDKITFQGSTTYHSFGLFEQIPPTPDFKGIVAPMSQTLVPGGSISFDITVDPLYGFTGDVTVGVIDIPNGITPSYNPTVVKGGSGTTTITLTAANTVPLGNYTGTLTGSSGSLYHTTTVPFTVDLSKGDWTGYVVQQSQNIAPGGQAQWQVVAQALNGFNGNISLNISGLPPGASANFNPPSINNGGGSTLLTVTTANATPQPQVYPMTVTGTDGLKVHSTTIYLGVSNSSGDFTGSIAPSSAAVSAAASGSANFTVSLSPTNGGAGDISLSAPGLPPGVTAGFNPGTIPASSGSSTFTLTASPGTPPGTYQVYVNASGSGRFHQNSVTLTVNP